MKPLVIPGRIPSKKNSKMAIPIHHRCVLVTQARYKEWHKEASQYLQKIVFPARVELTITFYFPDHRRTDLSNKTESIMDLLVDNGVLSDDNWTVVPQLTLIAGGVDKVNPRAEIQWHEPKDIKH